MCLGPSNRDSASFFAVFHKLWSSREKHFSERMDYRNIRVNSREISNSKDIFGLYRSALRFACIQPSNLNFSWWPWQTRIINLCLLRPGPLNFPGIWWLQASFSITLVYRLIKCFCSSASQINFPNFILLSANSFEKYTISPQVLQNRRKYLKDMRANHVIARLNKRQQNWPHRL